MKDMYTFDTDVSTAMVTYEAVSEAYNNFFNRLGIPWRRVLGDCGDIGGQRSHEYHFPALIGQDSLLICSNCDSGQNAEFESASKQCLECGGDLIHTKGIEVAHTFLLNDIYSSKLKAKYTGIDNSLYNLSMGCYGIGISRLIGACVEVLSIDGELRWPKVIAPFSVCVICPKAGSREAVVLEQVYQLYDELSEPRKGIFPNDVILDDRDKITVGKKLRDAYKMGYPYILLFGKDCADEENPRVELHCPVPIGDNGALSKTELNKIPLSEIQSVLSSMHNAKT